MKVFIEQKDPEFDVKGSCVILIPCWLLVDFEAYSKAVVSALSKVVKYPVDGSYRVKILS